ncbi:MAG: NADH-quinone oxidoreductase subunit J [Myxococcota bacterium]
MSVVTLVLMALCLLGALVAVSVRDIVHAIFGLATALLALAGLFTTLGSPFVGAMEVLIYVGGISVAMIFAVMLSPQAGKGLRETPARRFGAAVIAALFFAGTGLALLNDTPVADSPEAPGVFAPAALGHALLGDWLIAFEVLSLVLLLAIIGAVLIAVREAPARDPAAPQNSQAATGEKVAP